MSGVSILLIAIGLISQTQFIFPKLYQRVDLIISGEKPEKSLDHAIYGMIEISKLFLLICLSTNLIV
jgi:hypothetical protein